MTTKFTDGCYKAKTVKAVNKALDAGMTAVVTYLEIKDIVNKYEGNALFETAPREFVLSLIIEDRKLENWTALARIVGWRKYSETRPSVWTGVDAKEDFGGECPISWMDIEWVAETVGYDPCDIYNAFMGIAVDAKKDGDNKACSWFASQGLAAMNYYEERF
nr:hypothetical protein [uncultured Mediterranean phage uvMED]